MKAQINVSLPFNVNVYNVDGPITTIAYMDGNLGIIGVGANFWDALNDFRIELARAIHVLANKPHTPSCDFPAHREWGISLKSHQRL